MIKPGSSLGGARPKATVQDPDGALWIAKFPSKHDEYDIGAWEKTAITLASMYGLTVPKTSTYKFTEYGWSLSPLYDVNPIPYGEELSLNVTYDDNRIRRETLLEFAEFIDLDAKTAEQDIHHVLEIVRNNWEAVAKKNILLKNPSGIFSQPFNFVSNKKTLNRELVSEMYLRSVLDHLMSA